MVECSEMSASWELPKKVASYPTVSATYNAATYYYSATKSYNRITEFTANCAERAAGAVAQPLYNASLPVFNRFEPKLHDADKYAAEKLKQLEEKAPLMNEEPATIYQAAREATVSTINNSYVGQAVNYALQPVLKVAETFTPKASEESNEVAEEPTSSEPTESSSAPEEEMTLHDTVKRAYKVGTKLQQRALEKAMENVTSLRKRSQESLESLRHAVDLIQYAKNLESATGADKVRDFFYEIFEDEECEQAEVEESGDKQATETTASNDMSRKTLVVSRNLTRKLKGGYEATMTYAKPYLNEALFERLQHGQTLLEGIQKSFAEAKNLKDVSDSWIETTKANLDYLAQSLRDVSQETMSYLANMKPGSWLGIKGDLETAEEEGERKDSVMSYTPSESLDEDIEQKPTTPSESMDEECDPKADADVSGETEDDNTEIMTSSQEQDY